MRARAVRLRNCNTYQPTIGFRALERAGRVALSGAIRVDFRNTNMKTTQTNTIKESDWSHTVSKTYKRRYRLQQQDGCMDRGTVEITVPDQDNDDIMHDEIPEIINGELMGVKFAKWLERDPKQPVGDDKDQWAIDLFWERNFYPDLQTIANDLHKRGLLKAGDYTIIIDW